MQHETVSQMFQRYHNDKAKGVKRTPLHTLQECCEEAGIDPRLFGRYAAQHSGAPQPVLNSAKNVGRGAVKYYRKHEFVQWVNQVRKQKEKVMPDIRTALEKALSQTANAWAADDEAHQQIQPQQEKTMTVSVTDPISAPEKTDGRIKSNVSRATFYFVRDNPGLNAAQVTLRLMEQGHKAVSVGSLINQMVNTRMLMVDDKGRLSAVIKEYIPIQSKAMRAATKKPKAKPTPRPELHKHKQVTLINTRTGEVLNPKPAPAGIAALPAQHVTTAPSPTPSEWTVESVIGGLNVRQAMAVYMELKKIFGA